MTSDIPVLKIGAVIVHPTTRAVLIMQPIPKKTGENPAYVMPRGSRQYQSPDGNWHDARDAATGIAHAATLEPFPRGLTREIEEEAGITEAQLAAAKVSELGARAFQSRTKGIYPIHWYLVVPDAATAETVTQKTPVDALSIRWAEVAEIKAMAARGDFSAGYVPVIEEALAMVAGA